MTRYANKVLLVLWLCLPLFSCQGQYQSVSVQGVTIGDSEVSVQKHLGQGRQLDSKNVTTFTDETETIYIATFDSNSLESLVVEWQSQDSIPVVSVDGSALNLSDKNALMQSLSALKHESIIGGGTEVLACPDIGISFMIEKDQVVALKSFRAESPD